MRARRGTRLGLLLGLLVLALAAAPIGSAQTPPPIDPQNPGWQPDMTWDDYSPVPGTDWANPAIQPTVRKFKVALVMVDYPDQPFVISQPPFSTIFGNPQPLPGGVGPIPRDDVPEFYRDFLNAPSMLNHFQTMNKYWMENSYGKYGVQLDSFGPYRMPFNMYQYFVTDFSSGTGCPTPTVTPCNKNIRTDARAAWLAEVGLPVINSYDNIFYVGAGQDESGTWQEFGEMKFEQATVPEAFGPHAYDPTLPNWIRTRYVPWTSWASGASMWPNASGNTSIETEADGMSVYAHELSHNLGIADNYNNPFSTPQQRSATGPWDMLSRGTFNGPGGTHTRWMIPPTMGASLGSNHNLRNRAKLNFLPAAQIVRLNRNGLAASGMAVAKVKPRNVEPGPGGVGGFQITLDGTAPVDKSPACVVASNPLCPGNSNYNGYTMEVVQRIGNDTYTPGHGALITKTKTSESSSCGTFTCFAWIIDANPQDIDKVDFVRPDGSIAKVTIGDPRQLNDATFNAGLNSGSQYEYVDTANRLHFYVVDVAKDANGVLEYTLGVRSLDGAGPHTRGVALDPAANQSVPGQYATCNFNLTNTGAQATLPANPHPADVSAFLGSDIYRLSVASSGAGWSAELVNALAMAKFGESTNVPVYVTRTAGSDATGTVTLTATSESDATKTATGVCSLAVPAPGVSYTLNPAAPDGANGWYVSTVNLDWTVENATSQTGCADETFSTDGSFTRSCTATSDGGTTGPVSVSLKRDATAPSVSHALSPPAVGGFYHNPTVALSSSDATSGLASTEYRVDGGAWTAYGAPFAVTGDGSHTVDYRATDNAGNVGSGTVTFRIDTTAPVSTAVLSGTLNLGWWRNPTVTITSNDGAGNAGIQKIEYRLDGGAWLTYSAAFQVTGDGARLLEYRATDNTGNVEAVKSLAFNVDGNAPSTLIALSPPAVGGFYKSPTVTLTGSDGAGIGIAAIQYTLDGSGTRSYTGPFPVPGDGPHTITYRAVDMTGLIETTKTFSFTVDGTAPSSKATLSPAAVNGYYSGPTTVTLSSNDFASGSGIASIEYLLDGGGWTTYSAPLVVSGEGAHSIQFHATDNAGNVEGVKSKSFTIDTTGPVVSITTPSEGDQLELGSSVAPVYSCIDTASGVSSCSGAAVVETGPIGSHTYTVTAVDNAGNMTVETHTYDVVWPFSWVSPPSSGKAGKSVAGQVQPRRDELRPRDPRRHADVPAGQLHDGRGDGLLLERERLAQLLGRHLLVLLELPVGLAEHVPHAHARAR